MTFADLLHETATELGIAGLEPDDNGVAALEVDGKTTVFLEKSPFDENVGYAYAVLGRVPDSNREEFYAALLEAQLFGNELGGGCSFGLSRETGEIFLNQPFSLTGANAGRFIQQLSEFENWVEHWSAQIYRGIITNKAASDGPPDQFVRI